MRRLKTRLPAAAAVVHVAALLAFAGVAAAAAALPAGAALATGPGSVSAGSVTAGSSGNGDVDDFRFDSWHSDFRLSATPEGYSELQTTETIVANFDQPNQNRGIVRAIPTRYQGDPTQVEIEGVTDSDGDTVEYSTETSDDADRFLLVSIGGDEFVTGLQTYTITYSQNHVVLFPGDPAQAQEFYWDVNGTGWNQPIDRITARVMIDSALTDDLTGRTACYQGDQGASTTCDFITEPEPEQTDAGGMVVEAASAALAARQTLTVVVEFAPGTFTPRDDSFTATPLPGIALGATVLTLIALLAAAVARATRWRSAPGRATIIAEYLPPAGVNLLQSGDLSGRSAKAMTAQFLSFAVRGNLRILEGGKKNQFVLQLLGAGNIDDTERRILRLLFPGLAVGAVRDLSEKDAALTSALQKEISGSRRGMVAAGLRSHPGGSLRVGLMAGTSLIGLVAVIASFIALISEVGAPWPLITLIVASLTTLAGLALVASVRPLTAAGSELRDYLKGTQLYISLAETDRLRMLQSPEGALRSPSALRSTSPGSPPETDQVIELYERMLPLAVLFGEEKRWSGVLGQYYDRAGVQPGWYSGSGVFNAALFSAGIGSFTTTTTASWSGSAASSASSGAGGGGFAGGGGGGGGGGGR
ncbi:MAG: DUF2207 domain-containing protein [Cryobacterium sp.]